MSERQRILVTGGAKGLGAAIVSKLLEAGFDIDFTYRSSGTEAEARMREWQAAFPDQDVRSYVLDLSDKTALETFCEACEGQAYYGLIHNAGQSYDALTAMMDQAKAEAVMQVNFWSFARIVKSLMRGMVRARTGRILAIGSVAAMNGNPGNAAYAASKGALHSYCRTLSTETGKRGVTVNVIAPGFIDTDMMAGYSAYRATMEKQIPAGRFAQPDDIAGLAAFLMGPGAAYITGAILPVDGGLTAMMGVHRS